MTHQMRAPCKFCGFAEGRIETKNGQDCVYCASCGRHNYNAPKTETGRAVRTVSTVHEAITTGKRARILLRSNGRCEICGRKPNGEDGLHVGHLLSVKRGMEAGLSDTEINGEENLAAMCGECNLGIGDLPIPLRLAISIVKARVSCN